MVRKLINGYYALRWKILERDNFTCQYCGQKAPNVMIEVDHIKTKEEGGAETEENLITACRACNRGKGGLAIQIKFTKRGNGEIAYLPRAFRKPYHPARDRIMEILKECPLTTKQVAGILSAQESSTRTTLNRYATQGLIGRNSSGWYIKL